MIIETLNDDWPYKVEIKHRNNDANRMGYALQVTKNAELFYQDTFSLGGSYYFKREEHAIMFDAKYGKSGI